jgi:hypothetical protein
MPLSVSDLVSLNFGYLTGEDLLAWCPAPLLIKQYTVDANSLQNGCNQAYAFITSQFINRYDIDTEMAKVGTARSVLCAQLTSIMAIFNCLGNAQGISEKMREDFKWANKQIMDIRNGEGNLPLGCPPSPGVDSFGFPLPSTESKAELVHSSFKMLG